MKSKTKETLNELENYIKEQSYKLSFFKGYTAINKTGVEKLIDTIYANLPEDILRAREYLKNKNIELNKPTDSTGVKIYDLLNLFETELDSGFPIFKFTIVNIKKLEDLLDRIYCSLPKELDAAEKLNK